VTQAVCELVAVTKNIFAERCTGGGITGSQAAAVAKRARKWVIDYYQLLLGLSHTAKLHCLAVHLLDEFRLRAHLLDGNTGYNEKMHKAVKAAYKATNRRREQFVEQLLVNQQVSACLLEEKERPATADPDAALANAGRRSRPFRFFRRCTAAQLARNRKFLDSVLSWRWRAVRPFTTVTPCTTVIRPPRGVVGWPTPFGRHRASMGLRGMNSFSTLGRVAPSLTGKLHSLCSPGVVHGSDWSDGGQRKRHLIRGVY